MQYDISDFLNFSEAFEVVWPKKIHLVFSRPISPLLKILVFSGFSDCSDISNLLACTILKNRQKSVRNPCKPLFHPFLDLCTVLIPSVLSGKPEQKTQRQSMCSCCAIKIIGGEKSEKPRKPKKSQKPEMPQKSKKQEESEKPEKPYTLVSLISLNILISLLYLVSLVGASPVVVVVVLIPFSLSPTNPPRNLICSTVCIFQKGFCTGCYWV